MTTETSPAEAAALAHRAEAERRAAQVDGVAADVPLMPVRHVGIVGAGTMGRGIALAFLNAGIPVTVAEAMDAAREQAPALMRKSYDGQLRRGQITAEEVDRRLGLLTLAGAPEALAGCDLVIEAIFEDMDLKLELFRKLDALMQPGAILASNTSFLDIDAMAAVTGRPGRVIGMHFFSPANIMKLLEVVRGARTEPAVIATVIRLAQDIRKVPVVARVGWGFIGNRMARRRRETVERLVLEGAEPAQIDAVVERFGFAMGPFATSDLAGLDVGWSAATSTGSTTRELLAEAGRFGQKNGKGYYDYDADRKRSPSAQANAIIRGLAEKLGVAQRVFDDAEILGGILYPMINEAAKILAEGIAQRASDVDVVWLNGYGFPAREGGILYWADRHGLDKVLAGMAALEARYGADYAPAELLQRLVAEGRGFASV